jgi:DNA-binding NarL/FixJ family response regulator
MTNIEIVQMLADGYKVHEIAKEHGTTKLYVAKKINEIRVRCNCITYGHLIAVYFRKKLIE